MNETTQDPVDSDACSAGETARQQMRRWFAYDDSRPSMKNEHAMTALAGAGLALCALFAPTRGKAVCHAMLSGMLLFRAASGRDGLRRWAGAPDRGTPSLDG